MEYSIEAKGSEDMEGKIRLDAWRIEDCSLLIDINIIFYTVWNTIK